MSTLFNVEAFWMHLTLIYNDIDEGEDEVWENNDDDEYRESDDVL